MRKLIFLLAAMVPALSAANAAECRRVVEPTTIAVVAHGDLFFRKAERGLTFRAENCRTKIAGNLYCRMARYRQPAVYLKHADRTGREYTAFWGKDCN